MNKLQKQNSTELLDMFEDMQKLILKDTVDDIQIANFPDNGFLRPKQLSFFKIEELSFDENYPRREAFENVLQALNEECFNFVYILQGTKKGVELYLGVVNNKETCETTTLSANNCANNIMHIFEGNFNGSKLKKLYDTDLTDIIVDSSKKYKSVGAIVGVPSVNKEASDENDFQGIDRLINSMMGLEWRLVVICEPVQKSEIMNVRNKVYELYNRLSLYSKMTMQKTLNSGETISFGKNESNSRGKNEGWNTSETDSRGTTDSYGTRNDSTSKQRGKSGGISETHSEGSNYGYSSNSGSSQALTIEIANKHMQEMMKYIDEELLERIQLSLSKGCFKTSVYYMAEDAAKANRLKSGIISLCQGNDSQYSPLIAQDFLLHEKDKNAIVTTYQNHNILEKGISSDVPLLYSRPCVGSMVGLNTYLTAQEISLIAGLPQREVPGLALRESVEFGLNEHNVSEEDSINLGSIIQKGCELKNNSFLLDRKNLKKHTFIAGVTGSGKTTTCHRLLAEAKTPFMVIEPAKTEYRTLINSDKFSDIMVFTIGNEKIAPFRLNPFELVNGEVLSSHVDMLKATFTSAFPMEASMPQILEEAIYSCYQKKGWNIDTGDNKIYGEDAFNPDVDSFPILSDLLETMKEIVESKGFSAQMKADYIGSLVSRLSNLTVGSKGAMLNCAHSIDFEKLAERNVILELEELKSPEDKALVMGLIITKLAAVIKKKHGDNPNYQHITLIEEAHRLLSKVEYGDSGSKKVAVETFTDLLAEVRKYGESLIIVDQIPNKLAPEVIKNTNTKIIHKILAKDDKETVGDAMLMDDKQKKYLSALRVGETVIFTENTDKPIHVKIKADSNTNEAQIPNSVVKDNFMAFKDKFPSCYEYLEIAPYYSEYETMSQQLRKQGVVNVEEYKSVVQIVKTIVRSYEISEQEVWKKFIKKEREMNGFFVTNPECGDEIMIKLSDFFVDNSNKAITQEEFNVLCCKTENRKLLTW